MNSNYPSVQAIFKQLANDYARQPSLHELVAEVNLSLDQFRTHFSAWSPIEAETFFKDLNLNQARRQLAESRGDLEKNDAAKPTPTLHQLAIRQHSTNIEEFNKNTLQIEYGFHDSPFGKLLLCASQRGISALQFVEQSEADTLRLATLRFSGLNLIQNQHSTAIYIEKMFNPSRGAVDIVLIGTAFQLSVWNALLSIPINHRLSYQDIAKIIGRPKAFRAVGNAIGANPISILVPCHRVIRSDGALGGYAWGLDKKLAIMGWEASL